MHDPAYARLHDLCIVLQQVHAIGEAEQNQVVAGLAQCLQRVVLVEHLVQVIAGITTGKAFGNDHWPRQPGLPMGAVDIGRAAAAIDGLQLPELIGRRRGRLVVQLQGKA